MWIEWVSGPQAWRDRILEELQGRIRSVGELGASQSEWLNAINEGISGDKTPIPDPKKISGEGNVDVCMRLDQIGRYLKAESEPKSRWGDPAFAFR